MDKCCDCKEVNVSGPSMVCFDCAYPTPQARTDAWDQLYRTVQNLRAEQTKEGSVYIKVEGSPELLKPFIEHYLQHVYP